MPPPIGKILYIEDNADTRLLVSFLLRQQNYQVVAAEDPDKALVLTRTIPFDL